MVKQYIFTTCFINETTNRQKFGESGGYTLEKIFSTDLHELEKQPKTKVGGNLPLLPPSGGATDDLRSASNDMAKYWSFIIIRKKYYIKLIQNAALRAFHLGRTARTISCAISAVSFSNTYTSQLPIISKTISCVISAVSFSITVRIFTIAIISE